MIAKLPALLAILFALTMGSASAAPRKFHMPATPAQRTSRAIVWANTATGVYHLRGERWYGRTRRGRYVRESSAVRAGLRRTENGQ